MPESPVVIPETITVHLGAPSSNAQNVTVPFADYIKNVASSEIYPTWPEEAIRANIYAQISYVLNRVFTEWYRAQGYDFDITNSTRYDQSFVPGRDIFENISNIVDDMFNDYLTRGQAIEPLFAHGPARRTGHERRGNYPLFLRRRHQFCAQRAHRAQPGRLMAGCYLPAGRCVRGGAHHPEPPQPHLDQLSQYPQDLSRGRHFRR